MNNYIIRPVEAADVDVLNQTFNSEYGRTHADDLADQQRGSRSFLVAWVQDQPAGHVFIHWPGPRSPEPLAAYPGVPEIMRLSVLAPFERRGIATALINACETEAKARDIHTLGIGGDPALSPEQNLYIRLGYEDLGLDLFDDVYKRLVDGKVITMREPTRYLIKKL